MPSTYSTNLRLENIANGEQSGTWGDTTDNNICVLLEQAISGVVSVAMADANTTLSALNATSDESRNMVIELTGALTATRNVVCPTADKLYFVYNNTTGGQSIVFKTTAGTGITITNGKKQVVYCDGTNVVDAINNVAASGGTYATLTGVETLTNKTLTAPVITGLNIPDNQLLISDNADSTKRLAFEVSGVTTGTTRTWTVPNASDTLLGLTGTQSPTNKTFDNTNTFAVRDDRFTIQDSADATKQAVFEASGITTGTTRTYTLPNSDVSLGAITRNAQTGTTYTVLLTDRQKHITFSNASSVAVTQPQATTTFGAGWYAWYENIGAGVVTITPTTSTINTGTALVLRQYEWALITSDGTNYRALTTGSITGLPLVREIGTRGVPLNTQNGAYGLVLSDAGGCIYHTSATPHTYTIPANGSVAFPIGTVITIVNDTGAGNITLAITTDTLRRGDGTAGTGSRTIAADSIVTIIKLTSTSWMISGVFT